MQRVHLQVTSVFVSALPAALISSAVRTDLKPSHRPTKSTKHYGGVHHMTTDQELLHTCDHPLQGQAFSRCLAAYCVHLLRTATLPEAQQ